MAQSKPGMAAEAPSATVDLRVCNESGRNGTLAELASTDNANFYMQGETLDGSGRTWSGNHTLCVRYPGPCSFWSDGSDGCPAGYETRNFVVMHAEDVGPCTWTLEP